jgi:hypothetical protein
MFLTIPLSHHPSEKQPQPDKKYETKPPPHPLRNVAQCSILT